MVRNRESDVVFAWDLISKGEVELGTLCLVAGKSEVASSPVMRGGRGGSLYLS